MRYVHSIQVWLLQRLQSDAPAVGIHGEETRSWIIFGSCFHYAVRCTSSQCRRREQPTGFVQAIVPFHSRCTIAVLTLDHLISK